MNEPRYLNVDLVVGSNEDLTPIAEGFGQDVMVLFNGKWGEHYRAVFEIAPSHAAANEDIACFCSLIEGLEGRAAELWQRAFSREFDIGFESMYQRYSLNETAYIIVKHANVSTLINRIVLIHG